MSGEILLLMLVFIVLPLIEQAVKNARQKREGRTAPAPRTARTAPPPRAPEPFDEDEDDEPVAVTRPPLPPPLPQAPRPAPARHVPRPPRPAAVTRRPLTAAPTPDVPTEVLLAQRARQQRLAVSAAPELAAGAARRQRRVRLPELKRPASLRRAIVLQAVLGPCRANEPHV